MITPMRPQLLQQKTLNHPDFSFARDKGNYTCDELTRWLGSEKHYSNDKKEIIFRLLAGTNCYNKGVPVIMLSNVNFGSKRKYFLDKSALIDSQKCKVKDNYVVTFLSNFSINNNFSHFLHGLLRMFCALLDAQWIVWDEENDKFIKNHNFTIWIDEFFKLTPSKKFWLDAFGVKLRSLNTQSLGKGQCVSAKVLLYGSGCVKLLPPEKWHGYPHCRASQVLPAFGHFMRQSFNAVSRQDLMIIDDRSKMLDSLTTKGPKLKVAFAVRDVGDLTGMYVTYYIT